MPLRRIKIPIKFSGGIETKLDSKSVPPTKLLALENARFAAPGRLEKRNGHDETLPTIDDATKDLQAAGSIIGREGERYWIGNQTRSSGAYDEEDGWTVFGHNADTDELHDVGKILPVELSIHRTVPSVLFHQPHNPDIAHANGYTCIVHAANGAGAIYCSVYDESGATIVDNDYLATSMKGARVIAVGTVFHIWSISYLTNELMLAIVDTANLGAALSFTAKQADAHLDGIVDACYANDAVHGPSSVVAYKQTTTSYITRRWYDAAGGLRHSVGGTNAIQGGICVARIYDESASDWKIASLRQRTSDGNVYLNLNDEESGSLAANRLVTSAVSALTITRLTAVEDPSYDPTAANHSLRVFIEASINVYTATVRINSAGQTDSETIRHAYLASNAFRYNDRAHVLITINSTIQASLFLVSLREAYPQTGGGGNGPRHDAKILSSAHTGPLHSTHCTMTAVVDVGTNDFRFVATRKERIGASGIVDQSVVEIGMQMDSLPVGRCQCGPTVQVATGGIIGELDGQFTELGFLVYPEIASSAVQVSGGSFVDGDYYHRATYEWIDRAGRKHYSTPSPVFETTCSLGGSAQMIRVAVKNLLRSRWDRAENVMLCLYRLCSDGNYHYVNAIANGFLGASLNITDDVSDATALGYGTLYTTGGVLENICPPAAQIIHAARNRVLLVPSEDPENLWISKYKEKGLPVEFSDLLTRRISQGGKTTGINNMGDLIVVFKERAIYGFSGAGPNNLGIGSFRESYQISADAGCSDRGSVVKSDTGIFFKSGDKGICLLNAGRQVQYVGAPVSAWNSETVTSARHIADQNQVRFLMSSGDVLVYDYLVRQWSVYTCGYKGGASEPVDLEVFDGDATLLLDTGERWIEGSGFEDPNSPANDTIQMLAETAWIRRDSLLGADRIWWIHILGTYKSPHTLSVELWCDYETSLRETFTLSSDAAHGAIEPYEWRLMPSAANQRASAIKLRIYDSLQTGTAEGLSLEGIELIVGASEAPRKLRESRTK